MHPLPSIKQHKRRLLVSASFQPSSGGTGRMGEDTLASVAPPPPSAFQKPSASALRLLGLLKQPDSDPDLELDESDVVWSTTSDEALFAFTSRSADVSEDRDSTNRLTSPSPSPDVLHSPLAASSCSPSGQVHRPYAPERCGLSAALADDLFPLVRQRRPAAMAARATRPLAVSARRAEEASPAERVGYNQSAPVNVPTWSKWRKVAKAEVMEGLQEEERWEKERQSEEEKEVEEEEMVPPHVIVARSHLTTFSVFEGVGRTLKGRDLRRVRNAVLKKTGFIDV